MVYVLDTLGYTRKLEAAGVQRDHAEAHAEAIHEYIMSTVATKDDVNTAVSAAVATLSANDAALRAELTATNAALRAEIDKMGLVLTIRMGGIAVLGVGTLAALLKLT